MKQIDELAAAAISGVTEETPWQAFVRLLRAHFAGNHANIAFRRSDLAQSVLTVDWNPQVLAGRDPGTRYKPADDPISYYTLEPFRAYSIEDMIEESRQAEHPFLRDFLRPFGLESLLICRIVTDTGMQAWISITRETVHAFGPRDKQDLERIARLFKPALALFGAYKEAADRRDAYRRVLHAQGTGVARLDQNGGVLHLDPAAAEWVKQGRYIRLAGGQLRAVAAGDRAKFEEAQRSVLEGSSEEQILALQGADGDAIELLFFRVNEPLEPAWMTATRAIVYIRGAGREFSPSPRRLHGLFGLSRQEAALTILLTRGLTVTQASDALGVSELTARTYLRQVFHKTGVTRQTELVRRIQASVASIQ